MVAHVKICGIRNVEDAQRAIRLGADEIGFHIDLFGARSALSIDTASKIIAQLGNQALPVVVTSETDEERLVALAKQTDAAILQLYGNATPETVSAVKKQVPGLQVWKVIDVTGVDAIDNAKRFEGAADAIALDSIDPTTGQRGGTGKTHDWNISRQIVEALSIPVILAGGLNPDNIEEAIRTVKPYGVDVNSGVSDVDGNKSEEKIQLFIERAKKYE